MPRLREKAEQAIEGVNDAVSRAQMKLARVGIETLIERIPVKNFGFVLKLGKKAGVVKGKETAKAEFEALLADITRRRQRAIYAAQESNMAPSRLESVKEKLQKIEEQLKACQGESPQSVS